MSRSIMRRMQQLRKPIASATCGYFGMRVLAKLGRIWLRVAGDKPSALYLQFDQRMQPWKLLSYDRSKLRSHALRGSFFGQRACLAMRLPLPKAAKGFRAWA